MAINRERLAIVAGFVLLLVLLAGPVWQLRQQPLFGDGYDDALYFSGAKALASGDGYRMLSFPGQPWEVKYPPLYPLYLSLAWRVQPSFPANLSIASALQAALLPIFVLLLLLTLRSLGFVWRKAFLLAGLMLSSLAFVQLSTTLFSEILFLCFLLASILAIERAIESPRAYLWAATGGLPPAPDSRPDFLFSATPRQARPDLSGLLPPRRRSLAFLDQRSCRLR